MSIRFSSDARRDRREAQAYYRAVSPGALKAFARELDAALRFLIEHPLGAPVRDRDVRAKRLMHFPYTILYRVVGREAIFVLALSNQARDPEFYEARFD